MTSPSKGSFDNSGRPSHLERPFIYHEPRVNIPLYPQPCAFQIVDPRARASWEAAAAAAAAAASAQPGYKHSNQNILGATVVISPPWARPPMPSESSASGSSASSSSQSPVRPGGPTMSRELLPRPSSRATHHSNTSNSHSARHSHRYSHSHPIRPDLAYIRDPEKALPASSISSINQTSPVQFTRNYSPSKEMDEESISESIPAVKTLLFLSGLCVILSFLNALWACIAVLLTVLAQPLRIFTKRPDVTHELAGLLRPTLNLQLRGIYATPLNAVDDAEFNVQKLVMVHVLSPIVSFVIAVAGWISAAYWMVSAMLGDPAGQERRDDGRELVLALRKWWLHWLLLSVPSLSDQMR